MLVHRGLSHRRRRVKVGSQSRTDAALLHAVPGAREAVPAFGRARLSSVYPPYFRTGGLSLSAPFEGNFWESCPSPVWFGNRFWNLNRSFTCRKDGH